MFHHFPDETTPGVPETVRDVKGAEGAASSDTMKATSHVDSKPCEYEWKAVESAMMVEGMSRILKMNGMTADIDGRVILGRELVTEASTVDEGRV